jgi:hypothetical protein
LARRESILRINPLRLQFAEPTFARSIVPA